MLRVGQAADAVLLLRLHPVLLVQAVGVLVEIVKVLALLKIVWVVMAVQG
jgi:hypothetical protein